MMKRLLTLALFAPAVTLAQENEVSYDYFDVDLLSTTIDVGPTDEDGHGIGGKFSIDFSSRYFIFGDYHAWDMNDLPGEPGSVAKTIGLGKAGKFGQRWSLYGGIGFRSLDLDLGTGTTTQEEGGVVMGGARIRFADTFEFRVGAEYADVVTSAMSGIIGEASVTAGFDLHMTDVAAITVEVKENEESVSTLTVGVRFYPTKETRGMRQRR
jgi:hypothetical protein